jgi:hypothetical protein
VKNSTTSEADYSTYTLSQLFKARYWTESRGRLLEAEIQERCAHIRERISGKPFASADSRNRFKPYGLIFGVACLLLSVGPYAAVMFIDMIQVFNEPSGENGSLSGVWALLTLPGMVIVFLVGSLMDAERIVEWFDLDGGA